MTTWDDVLAHLRSTYRLTVDEPGKVVLDFECDEERAQRIVVSTFEAMGKGWVLFRSRVCELSRLDPVEALRRNSTFAVGFLAISDEHYEICYTSQLDTLDIDELELPLHALTDTADTLERELTGTDRW
jgi:hypothetical protein